MLVTYSQSDRKYASTTMVLLLIQPTRRQNRVLQMARTKSYGRGHVTVQEQQAEKSSKQRP
jgi:hypothetical protein